MATARSVLVLVGATCFTILALYHFTHSPRLPLGERVGTLVFELLIASIGFLHLLFRLRARTQTTRPK